MAVRDAIHKRDGEVLAADVERLTSLYADRWSQRLGGIECLTKLEELVLNDAQIADLSPLARLPQELRRVEPGGSCVK
jgi:hypothetical protein